MELISLFIICFLIIYLTYYLTIVRRQKGLEAFKKGKQLNFFKNAYKLDTNNINHKKFANELALINAFIISITITTLELFDSYILKLLIGFIMLIPLILICYSILGKKYKKKEGK